MYGAIVPSDEKRAKQLGDNILDICMSRGCYSTFLCYTADEDFERALDEREFNTVIITATDEAERRTAKMVADKKPKVKLILLGSAEMAVEGYTLHADYCSAADPQEEDMRRIVEIIFPIERMKTYDN